MAWNPLGIAVLGANDHIGDHNKIKESLEYLKGKTDTPAGMSLVKPTSIAYSGGSASVGANGLVTFTGVTSLSLNGAFTTTFDMYRVLLNAAAAASTSQYWRYRAAGADKTDAVYNASQNYGTGNNAYTGATNVLMSMFDTVPALTTLDVANPATAAPTTAAGIGSRAVAPLAFGHGHTYTPAVAVDGFTIYAASALTGTLAVYGYAK